MGSVLRCGRVLSPRGMLGAGLCSSFQIGTRCRALVVACCINTVPGVSVGTRYWCGELWIFKSQGRNEICCYGVTIILMVLDG